MTGIPGAGGTQHGGAIAFGLGIRPVVELALPAPRRQPPHVRPLGVRPLEVLVGDVALLVPVVLLRDAEVDERPVPDVRKAHLAADVTPRRGRAMLAASALRRSVPLRHRADSRASAATSSHQASMRAYSTCVSDRRSATRVAARRSP